ncbi:helix-turn-helix domain-containing protein [Dactylosporangium aurantiacum]|uniref:Helix-turn-helix domain-containing protein n=1 Tax=Dactylosporangium aurantiacum TaxID=35754 RepID=A0A9Q9I8S0_9ACTN|nr:XRE family transcriptional regulator [Dactylosporangium aurantiacum]MDG6107225.1 NB-ARC domain-containing protein [Dactylosporangium aurantiacum]UWZ51241.1 helix-turn-helix domain-containing protein [Dactylosporangium aurantiacum]
MTHDGFASLLRGYRRRLGLTQAALAERSAVSERSIRSIERGGRVPRRYTAEQLAGALDLTDEHLMAFLAAADGLLRLQRATAPDRPPVADGAAAADLSRPVPRPVPRQLPVDVGDFVGRDAELRAIVERLGPHGPAPHVVALAGPAGIGKTALALHVAHRLAPQFPDGQLYLPLHGVTSRPVDPGDALAQLLRALGLNSAALPAGADARAALLREQLADRRVLVVLDDASGHEQVAALLPGGGNAVVITGRLPLTGLPGVTVVDLAPLDEAVALRLFAHIAGPARVATDPGGAADVAKACGGLPLAVRVAAARLAAHPRWTVRLLADRLGDERQRLEELRHGDLAVRPSLRLGYQTLSAPAARAFALLGTLPVATFPEWVVAALLDAPAATGAGVLRELLDARLLDEVGVDRAGQLRYRFHDLTRLFALECHEAAGTGDADPAAVVTRAAGAWLGLARQARDGLQCERLYLDEPRTQAVPVEDRVASVATRQPVDWFEAEREALTALALSCADTGSHAVACALIGSAADFFELRGYYTDWQRMSRAALAACRRAGDRPGEIAMRRSFGITLLELDDLEAALEQFRTVRQLAHELGAHPSAAMAGKEIGFVLGLLGRLDEAEWMLRTAEEELDRIGRQDSRALALTSLAFVLRQRGESGEAVRIARAAQALGEAQRNRFVQAYAGRGLAGALLSAGLRDEAAHWARRAAELYTGIGDPIGAGQSLRALGEALADDPAHHGEAERLLRGAATLFRGHGYRWGLALTELSLGELLVRRGTGEAVEVLRASLRFWSDEAVPALLARALVALADAEERRGGDARTLLEQAFEHYTAIGSPAAAAVARRLDRAARVASAS